MKWAVLCLGVLGAILYLTGVFIPSPDNPSIPPESVGSATPEQASRRVQIHAIDPTAPPSLEETVQNAAAAERHTSTGSLSSESPSPNAAQSSNNAEQLSDTWGQLLRGAPVHSGPSVSSAKLGYASAGAEMRLLERNLGWVRIMDPATAREGWIYEEHVTVKEGPGDSYQEAAIASEMDSVILKKPKRSFKPKKSRKNYAKKRWRKRFVLRFRRF
jgi:hypothetical protein